MPKNLISSSKSKPAVSERVSAYRDRLTTSAYHRVDVVMPDDKRERIEKIAGELKESYAQTVSALAQLGLDQMEATKATPTAIASGYFAAHAPLIPQHALAQSLRIDISARHPMDAMRSLSVFGAMPIGATASMPNTHDTFKALATGSPAPVPPSESPGASGSSSIESPLMAFFRKRKAAP